MPETKTQQTVTGVTPYLTIKGAADAIEFYKKAFGATELMRMPGEDGKRLLHAHIRINDDDVLMSDDFQDASSPPSGVTMHLQVDDADTWWKRALGAGAKVKMELADQFWGDRYGIVVDPFGHCWSIASAAKT
jgi:PhnB protein